MSKVYFTIVEKAENYYECELPEDFEGTVKDFAKKFGVDKLFEHSLYVKTIDFLGASKKSIKSFGS